MSIVKRFWVLVALIVMSGLVPSIASAASERPAAQRQVRVISISVPKGAAASEKELREYAQREAKARGLDEFEGGHVVIVPVAAVVLAAILLLILL